MQRFTPLVAFVTLSTITLVISGCRTPPTLPTHEIKPTIIISPTAPASIDHYNIVIIGATDEERIIIKNAIGFFAARTPEIFLEGYAQRIWVCANNDDGHFDAITTPNIAAHYHERTYEICILRPNVSVDMLFHELSHAVTLRRYHYEFNIIESWRTSFPSVYGTHRYSKKLRFPFRAFPCHYATTNDNEHRAEWIEHLYLLLYEYWLQSSGDPRVFDNPLKYRPLNAWHRQMLQWSFDHHEITAVDYAAVTNNTPKK